MISTRIGPDFPFAVVGAPSYFDNMGIPEHLQELVRHNCINERLPTGGFRAWEFEDDGKAIRISVEEQLAFNNSYQSVEAALHGLGLAYVPEDVALTYIAKGRLRRPSRRQSSPAFVALVDVLRHRS